jgi:hypothetical protein
VSGAAGLGGRGGVGWDGGGECLIEATGKREEVGRGRGILEVSVKEFQLSDLSEELHVDERQLRRH